MNAFRAFLNWSKRLPIPVRWMLSVMLVAAATALRWLLDSVLVGYPYTTFFAAVVLSSVLLDKASGFLATLLGGLVGTYLFVPPRYSVALAKSEEVVALFLFFGVCFVVVLVSEALRFLVDALDEEKAQKETLFRQLTHRTRNNLQIISSVLAIQAMKTSNPEVRSYLDAVAERIGTIGRIQQRLYPPSAPERVDAAEMLEGTCSDLSLMLAGRRAVLIRHQAESFPINRELAASLAMILGELVDNAVRHAYPNGQPSAVLAELSKRAGDIAMTVSDAGVGCAGRIGTGTGTTLVSALVKQLNGTVTWEDARPGCRVTVRIPD